MAVNFSVSLGRVASKGEVGWESNRVCVASASSRATAGAPPGLISHAVFVLSTQFENKIQFKIGRK